MSDKTKDLSEIDLTQFVKAGNKKRDPICKGCNYNWCGDCREERELGRNLKGVFEVFIGQLLDSLDLDYLFDESKIDRILDGFALRIIRELKMQIKLNEGE